MIPLIDDEEKMDTSPRDSRNTAYVSEEAVECATKETGESAAEGIGESSVEETGESAAGGKGKKKLMKLITCSIVFTISGFFQSLGHLLTRCLLRRSLRLSKLIYMPICKNYIFFIYFYWAFFGFLE